MGIIRSILNKLRNRSLVHFYWMRLKYRKNPRFQKTLVNTPEGKFSVPDTLSFIWQYREIFALHSYKFQTQQKSPLIIDCGSNVGASLVYFRQHYPSARIISLEADPDLVIYLKSNLKENNVDDVEVISKAAWSHNGQIEFAADGVDGGSIVGSGQKKVVECLRFSELLAKLAQIDFLKMDIEGAEFEVLRDCEQYLSKVQNLFVEYHSRTGQEQMLPELLAILKQAGFRVYSDTIISRKTPFIHRGLDQQMDLQMNIFAFRV